MWLQLQAYHAARTLEEQDNYLEEARRDVDNLLDEVINFCFDSKKSSSHILCGKDDQESSDEGFVLPQSDEDEFVTFKTSFDDNPTMASSSPKEASSTPIDINEKPTKEKSDNLNTISGTIKELDLDLDGKKSEKVLDLRKLRADKVSAMQEIVALIQKIESVEALYPNTKALVSAHPKYKDVKFVRNMEALYLWLNVNKELYHCLNGLADWIDVDPDDFISWRDWFDCGLGSVFLNIQ